METLELKANQLDEKKPEEAKMEVFTLPSQDDILDVGEPRVVIS